MPPLILASTSPYRRELLARLQLRFEVVHPGVEETAAPGETPASLARRLARSKALAVARMNPRALVIGSDQVADLDGAALGKPGHRQAAFEQLHRMQGRRVDFHTAVAVACGNDIYDELVTVSVTVRALKNAEIERYLDLEPSYDCAGSAKVEGLGICLLQSVRSDDPTALIGLPLIATCNLLRQFGLDPLA